MFALVLTGVIATPGAAVSQERTFTLAAPQLTLAEPLTTVAGLAELVDGRLLIADSRERQVRLASADGKTVTVFGSQGEGPLEYRSPFGVYRAPGDSLLVFDSGNRRYLVVTPDGRIAREIGVPELFLTRGGIGPALGVDARGRIYWQGDVIDQLPTGVKRRLAQNVRRWSPGREDFDTVASPADHAPEMHEHRFHPFAERDAVVIAKDGRVGVLSAREYRLRWYVDGTVRAEGPALPHDPIPVTAASRAAFRKFRAENPAGGARMTGPPSSEPSPSAIRRMEEAYPDVMFPKSKPPFIEQGAKLSPAEDIWVTRSGIDGAKSVRIDVLSNTGARKGHLMLPPGRRLVALGVRGVYLARTDEDGFEWVERYAWPAGLR